MKLLILFVSEEWRSYAASLASDESAWRAANPGTVEVGPFDEVVVERGRVTGIQNGEALEVAHCERGEPWRLEGRERPYDQLKIVLKAAACFAAA